MGLPKRTIIAIAAASAAALVTQQFTAATFNSPTMSATQASYSTTGNAANFGKCIDFNGTNQWARIPSWAVQFYPTQNWTIRGRIRTTQAGAGPFVFMASGSTGSGSACSWWLALASNKIKLTFPGFTTITGTTTINDGAWHDWKVECTGGTSITVYVDDVSQGTAAGTYPSPKAQDNYATFGAYLALSQTPSFWFTGQLANVAVFDAIGTGSAPTAPYTGSEANIRFLWQFDGSARQYVDCGMYAATACTVPVQNIASATSCMSRSRHIAKNSINGLRLGYCNFSTIGGAPAGSSTYVVSVEYAGTIYPVTWNGASSTTVIDNQISRLSDLCAVNIPNGAEFFVRTYHTNTASVAFGSGVSYETGIAAIDTANGESMSINTTDQTASTGAITGGTPNTLNVHRPSIIVAKGVRKAYWLVGDSRNQGLKDAYTGTNGLKGQLPRIVGSSYGYGSYGAPGATLSTFVTATNRHVPSILGEFASHIINEYSVNDLAGGATPATILSNLAILPTLWAASKPVYQTTITPWTTSTDSWATVANQTVMSWEANRVSLNTSIRAVLSGFAGYLEATDVVENTRNGGKWVPGYTPDGVHETNTANIAIAAAISPP